MSKLDENWKQVLNILRNTISTFFFQVWIQRLEPVEIRNRVLYLIGEKNCKERCMNPGSEVSGHLTQAIMKVFETQIDKFEVLTEEEYKNLMESDKKAVDDQPAVKLENNFIKKYTFENFIVGQNNNLVFAAAKTVAENPGVRFNPLFIYGGVGLGKTHLLHAIGMKVNQEKPELRVLYSPCEKFIREYIASITSGQNSVINEFREKYRNVDVLLIDDIHNLMGKKESQEEFFNTFKDLFEANRQIVLTSDRSPDDIDTLEERLKSRFKGGLIYNVQKPDYETKYAILQKKAEQENYKVDPKVISAIAERMDTNIRELEGMLQKISFMANLYNKEYADMEDAEMAFQQINVVDKEVVTAERIINVVCEYSNIPKEDMVGKKKTKDISDARQIAMYLICDMLDIPLGNIGKLFGGRDHTTVIHARDKIISLLKNDTRLQKTIKDLKDKLR